MIFVMFGWCGTLIYLVNHAYISLVPQRNNAIYYGGNFLAAILLVISSVASGSYQAVVINGFWALISIVVFANLDLKRLPVSRQFFNAVIALFAIAILYNGLVSEQLDIRLLGWSSAFVFSASYLLFSVAKIRILTYLLWNAYAAFALLPQVWLDENWPVFGLEVCWGCISIYGALRRFNQIHLID